MRRHEKGDLTRDKARQECSKLNQTSSRECNEQTKNAISGQKSTILNEKLTGVLTYLPTPGGSPQTSTSNEG
jgi:hypothetical protein